MNANVLPRPGIIGSAEKVRVAPSAELFRETSDWTPANFAREQIRSLVRRVFFTSGTKPAKHVVFSAAQPQTDVGLICDQVGRTLAMETSAEIAIVSRNLVPEETVEVHAHPDRSGESGIKSWSSQIASNLWRVPQAGLRELDSDSGIGQYWLASLAALQNDFEYLVIHGPAAGASSESALLGQLADGIVLVLEAHSTKRAAARKIKQTLEDSHSRILGTVLNARTFPVPERIYRRL